MLTKAKVVAGLAVLTFWGTIAVAQQQTENSNQVPLSARSDSSNGSGGGRGGRWDGQSTVIERLGFGDGQFHGPYGSGGRLGRPGPARGGAHTARKRRCPSGY